MRERTSAAIIAYVFLFPQSLLLGSCSGVRPVMELSPMGQQLYVVHCAGRYFSWEACYQQADEVCNSRGYEVVSSSADRITNPADSDRNIKIVCKK